MIDAINKDLRKFLSSPWLIASLVFLHSCKKKAEISKIDDTNSPNPSTPEEVKKDVATEEFESLTTPSSGSLQIEFTSKSCPKFYQLSLDPIAWVKEFLTPTFKWYGKPPKVTLGLTLPKYHHDNLMEIYLCYENGQLIMQKKLLKTDKNPDKTIKEQVYELAELEALKNIYIVFRLKNNVAYKFNLGLPQDLLTFKNQKVHTLYNLSLSQSYKDFQSSFQPDISIQGLVEDLGKSLSPHHLVYYSSPGFKHSIITNLVGDIISEHGEEFKDYINYSHIVVYRNYKNSWIRTLIKLAF
jgi:hypothetical protein